MNSQKYYDQKLPYSELVNDDEKNTDSDRLEYLIAYGSAAFFITGLIFGGIAL